MKDIVDNILDTDAVAWGKFRLTLKKKSLKRNAVQAFVEGKFHERTGAFKIIVLENADMSKLASNIGGRYVVKGQRGTIVI